MQLGELIKANAYKAWAQEGKVRTALQDQPDPFRLGFEAGLKYADVPVFLPAGNTSVEMRRVVRASWEPSAEGLTGYVRLDFANGSAPICIAFDSPQCQAIARAVGFGDLHADWPGHRTAAAVALREKRAAEKAAAEEAELKQAMERAERSGLGGIIRRLMGRKGDASNG